MLQEQGQDVVRQIDKLAVIVQVGATFGLSALFLLVRRRSPVLPFLTAWSRAWQAYLLALIGAAASYDVFGVLGSAEGWAPLRAGADFVYLSAKFAFFLLVLEGAWSLARGRAVPPSWRLGGLAFVVVLGAAGQVATSTVGGVLRVQSFVSVPALLGATLFVLQSRRPDTPVVGRLLLGVGLGLMLALQLGYGSGLGAPDSPLRQAGGPGPAMALAFVLNNSFVDTMLQGLVAYGMAGIVTEEVAQLADRQRGQQLAALSASELRLTRIIDAALDPIFTLDEHGRIIQANAATALVFRLPSPQLVGRTFTDFLAPTGEFVLPWTDAGEPLPTAQRARVSLRRADGELFPADLSLAPIGPDRRAGFVLMVRDESEAEQAAADRERLRNRLAQAQRLETVGQLVSGVAHELNNPLAAILAFTEELKHSPLGAAEAETLATIEQQTVRCRGIVRDLLRVARRREVRLQPIALKPLLERVVRGFTPQAAENAVTLRLDVPGELPAVIGDDTGMEQVVANLVMNAVQVTRREGRVTVGARVVGGQLRITVDDEGTGLSPDVQKRLFEPFFTTKPEGEGTGLGLAVSKGLIEQFGGHLTLENRADGVRGARAQIDLPISAEAVSPAAPTKAPDVRGFGRHALVIDDEAPVRSAVRRWLTRHGWQVDESADGREGLERLTGEGAATYAVIVCDLRMPNLTGVELHDLLAAQRPDLLKRIVIITGDIASPSVVDFLARTWAPVIEKPFDLDVLGAEISRIAAQDVSNPQTAPTS